MATRNITTLACKQIASSILKLAELHTITSFKIQLYRADALHAQHNADSHGVSERSQSQDIGRGQSSRVVRHQTRGPVGHLESSRRRPVGGRGESEASGDQGQGGGQDHNLVGRRSEVLGAHDGVRAASLGPRGSGLSRRGWIEYSVSGSGPSLGAELGGRAWGRAVVGRAWGIATWAAGAGGAKRWRLCCDSTASQGIRKSRLPVTARRRNRSRYPQTPASFYDASYCVADPSNGSPSARSSSHRRRTPKFVSPVPKSTGETPRTFARAGEDVRRASIVTGPIKFEILSADAASYHRSSPD